MRVDHGPDSAGVIVKTRHEQDPISPSCSRALACSGSSSCSCGGFESGEEEVGDDGEEGHGGVEDGNVFSEEGEGG